MWPVHGHNDLLQVEKIRPPAIRRRLLVKSIGPQANVRWGRIQSSDACGALPSVPLRRLAASGFWTGLTVLTVLTVLTADGMDTVEGLQRPRLHAANGEELDYARQDAACELHVPPSGLVGLGVISQIRWLTHTGRDVPPSGLNPNSRTAR